MQASALAWSAAFTVALVAVVISDCLHRRIPNGLSIVTLALGLSFWGSRLGLAGVGIALEGAFTGGAMLLLLYVLHWVGAGDVKIFAALGASLGPEGAFTAALYGLAVGGVIALWQVWTHPAGHFKLDFVWFGGGAQAPLARARRDGTTIPLAAALAAGVLLANGGVL